MAELTESSVEYNRRAAVTESLRAGQNYKILRSYPRSTVYNVAKRHAISDKSPRRALPFRRGKYRLRRNQQSFRGSCEKHETWFWKTQGHSGFAPEIGNERNDHIGSLKRIPNIPPASSRFARCSPRPSSSKDSLRFASVLVKTLLTALDFSPMRKFLSWMLK